MKRNGFGAGALALTGVCAVPTSACPHSRARFLCPRPSVLCSRSVRMLRSLCNIGPIGTYVARPTGPLPLLLVRRATSRQQFPPGWIPRGESLRSSSLLTELGCRPTIALCVVWARNSWRSPWSVSLPRGRWLALRRRASGRRPEVPTLNHFRLSRAAVAGLCERREKKKIKCVRKV